MEIDQIIVCLEQKEILLTKIMDLTKQIEVRCRQEHVVLEDLFEQREMFMKRVDKCDHLIAGQLREQSPEYRTRLQTLLLAKEGAAARSDEERKILRLAESCSYIKQKAMSIDRSANDILRQRCEQMRKEINANFKQTGYTTMFHPN